MKWFSKCQVMATTGVMLSVFLLGPSASAGGSKVNKYRYSDVDMPVSLR